MIDRFNQYRGFVYNALAVLLSLFVLVAVNFNLFDEQANLALFGLFGLLLVFLGKPLGRTQPKSLVGDENEKSKPIERFWESLATKLKIPLRALDVLLIVATIVIFGYVFTQSETLLKSFWVDGTLLGDRAGNEKTLDFVFAGIGLLLVLEATRRSIGWTLPILCTLFVLYALYGQSMPEWLIPHRGKTWQQISQKTFLSGGVFGIALKVMFLYVFLFVLFGTLLEQTGATGYVIKFARRLFKNSAGGPAKVAVVSSGLMGSLSGSAVANTATTGTFTIPLMKSSGFDSETAAGVEAAASSGGALMPPIMGAGAYMMLEMVEPKVTYLQIIKAALIPAILYYTALLMTVHFHSKRIGARAEEIEKDDPSKMSMYQGFIFFGSFVILIYMLTIQGSTPFRAVSVSLIGILVMSFFNSRTRLIEFKNQGLLGRVLVALSVAILLILVGLWFVNGSAHSSLEDIEAGFLSTISGWVNWLAAAVVIVIVTWFCDVSKIYKALVGAANGGMALIVAASCVGIILGVVDLTGLGTELPAKIQASANENSIVALLMLMCSTLLLGMGLPSTVCYLLMALLVGSMLQFLDTPPLAAHLFIFYFGMMSMVTPPVALAAYAGAAIAKADVMRTAFAAFKFALVGFALPFAFVLRPELLMLTAENSAASPAMIAGNVGTTLVAIFGLSSSIAGYGFGRMGWPARIVLLVSSLLIFLTRWQDWQFTAHMIAVGLVVAVMTLNFATRNQKQ